MGSLARDLFRHVGFISIAYRNCKDPGPEHSRPHRDILGSKQEKDKINGSTRLQNAQMAKKLRKIKYTQNLSHIKKISAPRLDQFLNIQY